MSQTGIHKENPSMLIVEDDPLLIEHLSIALEQNGLPASFCRSGKDALELFEKQEFRVVVLDLHLPDTDGLELLNQLKKHDSRSKIIIHTGFASLESAMGAVNGGAFAYMEKLVGVGELMDTIHTAFLAYQNEISMEQELLKTQKLESVGVLAGGIAHEFNNLLNGFILSSYYARKKIDPENEAWETLKGLEKRISDAGSLSKQLLTFSKGGEPIRQTIFINEFLRDAVEFALTGSNVYCEFSIPEDIRQVNVDEGQLNQVIYNIMFNSVQAMPEGGIVQVGVENVLMGANYGLPLPEGEYVKIAIQDEGSGIPRDTIQKVFDPFFTTKEQNSGLGLSVAYSVILKHDGWITAESRPGTGATFCIYLPEVED